jgi:tRNA dimethylallyltransferase
VVQSRIPLLVIVGPTAIGKTGLALNLARRFDGEIVSADSRQIYRLMDIGTAKPTPAQRALVPHHLLDVVWPDESYTLAHYQRAAMQAIAAVWARGHLPLLVGGTGLYVRAVVDGLAIPAVPPQPELRSTLYADAEAHGPAALHARLVALDPVGAAALDPANVRRLVRALEVCLVTGQPYSAQRGARPTPFTPYVVGLNADRPLLYAWADARVEAMVAAGLVAEVGMLRARGYDMRLPALSSLGYREFAAHLRGEQSLRDATARTQQATHAYIRRQLTWFRRDQRIHWLDAADATVSVAASRAIAAWLTGHSVHAD